MQRPVVLAAVMILLSACARVDSENPVGLCPPILHYSKDEKTLVADEVTALHEDAKIIDWLADYAVLREQVRSCDRLRRAQNAMK
jgi:hypothetical protein